MKSLTINDLSLSDFISKNKDRLYEEGRKNVKLNKNGKPTISRNDPWFNEDEWDELFRKGSNK